MIVLYILIFKFCLQQTRNCLTFSVYLAFASIWCYMGVRGSVVG
jgi:hypothetical protein